jgi:hypothetical protein
MNLVSDMLADDVVPNALTLDYAARLLRMTGQMPAFVKLLGDEDMSALARVATTHEPGALEALTSRPAWQTITAIAAAEGAADAEPAAADTAAATDQDASAPGADAGTQCPHCTFINPPGSTDCEVCGLPL